MFLFFCVLDCLTSHIRINSFVHAILCVFVNLMVGLSFIPHLFHIFQASQKRASHSFLVFKETHTLSLSSVRTEPPVTSTLSTSPLRPVFQHARPEKPENLKIYEAHVGAGAKRCV